MGILVFVLALVERGPGAASIASVAALIGVCGRIWISISRPPGAYGKNKAKVALAPNKWEAKFETESQTDGDGGGA